MKTLPPSPRRVAIPFVPLLAAIAAWSGLAVSAWPQPAEAATYYVATTGNDGDPGNAANPWATVQKAATTAVAGDTVYVMAGEYKERVSVANAGAPGAYITFSAYPGHVVTLNAAGLSTNAYFQGVFTITNVSYVKVQGFRLINSVAFGAVVYDSHHIEISGNSVYNTRYSGIGVWISRHVIVDGNEVEYAATSGEQECISVSQSSAVQVSRNHVHNNARGGSGGDVGIDIKNGSFDVLVKANHVHNLSTLCLYVDAYEEWTHDIVLDGNLVHDCAGIAVASERGGLLDRVTVQNNVVFHNYSFGFAVGDWGTPGYTRRMNDIKVINNTFYENGWDNGAPHWGGGIFLFGTPGESMSLIGFVARNNIFSQNTTFQILDRSNGVGTVIEHNLIHGVVDGEENSIRGANYIEGDPLFADVALADFRLRPGSPAVDRGKVEATPPADYDNRTRPLSIAPDLGAFEYPLGGGGGGPAVYANFNGQRGNEIVTANPLSLDLDFSGTEGREVFLTYRDADGRWAYLDNAGQPRPLPSDLRDVTPLVPNAPAQGRWTVLSNVTVSPGTYEFYLSLDYHRDGRLTMIGEMLYGVYTTHTVVVGE